MLADSTAWLFVARGIQGVATGLALGAASAALLDLHPARNPSQVGLTNGVVSAGGMGLGVLISATLVEFAPAPRVLPYVVLLALFAIAFAGALRMPEPVSGHGQLRLTPQSPHVPASVRRPFFLAALAVISSWSIGGLFLSLGPALSAASSTPTTTSWPGSACSHWPAPAPRRSSRSARPRPGPARPAARSRWPPA